MNTPWHLASVRWILLYTLGLTMACAPLPASSLAEDGLVDCIPVASTIDAKLLLLDAMGSRVLATRPLPFNAEARSQESIRSLLIARQVQEPVFVGVLAGAAMVFEALAPPESVIGRRRFVVTDLSGEILVDGVSYFMGHGQVVLPAEWRAITETPVAFASAELTPLCVELISMDEVLVSASALQSAAGFQDRAARTTTLEVGSTQGRRSGAFVFGLKEARTDFWSTYWLVASVP